MAITTGIYYHTLFSTGSKSTDDRYTLFFVPGSSTNLNADDLNSANWIEMPSDFITGCTLKRAFPDDMPLGLELPAAMTLDFNMKCPSLPTALKTYIIQEQSTGGTIASWTDANGAAIIYKVPNRWYIAKHTVGSLTQTQIIFDGYQERTKSKKYTSDGKYTINIMDAFATIMRNIPIADVGRTYHDYVINNSLPVADELLYFMYVRDGLTYTINNPLNDITGIDSVKIKSVPAPLQAGIIGYVMTRAAAVQDIYRRLPEATTSALHPISYPVTHWDFYKQNTTDTDLKGDAIADNSILLGINSLYFYSHPETIVGGLMSDTSSEGCWGRELKNCHNLFKMLAETFFCKMYWNYDDGGVNPDYFGDINLNSSPLFSYITNPAAIAINNTNVRELTVEIGTEYEQSIVHVNNLNDGDISEFSYKNPQLGIDEGAYEQKNYLHNCLPMPDTDTTNSVEERRWSGGGTRKRMSMKNTITQTIFYYDTVFDNNGADDEARIGRINEQCSVYYSDTQKVSNDAVNDADIDINNHNVLESKRSFATGLILPRQVKASIPVVVAKAANLIFNNKTMGTMEFETNINTISIADLGRGLHVDFDSAASVLGFIDTTLSNDTPNAVITNLEWDLFDKTRMIKVKAFVRGWGS